MDKEESKKINKLINDLRYYEEKIENIICDIKELEQLEGHTNTTSNQEDHETK